MVCIEVNGMLLDNTQTRLRNLIFEMELMEDNGSNLTEIGNRFCDVVLMGSSVWPGGTHRVPCPFSVEAGTLRCFVFVR